MTSTTLPAARSTLWVVLGRATLVVAAILLWAFATEAASPAAGLAMFAAAIVLVGYALRRVVVLAALLVWFMGLGLSRHVPLAEPVAWVALGVVPVWIVARYLRPGPRPAWSDTPAAWLADGPIVAVAPTSYEYAKGRRLLRGLAIGSGVATLVGGALLLARQEVGVLALPAAILALTFGAVDVFTGRMGVRIDAAGIHQRRAFGAAQSVPWTRVSGLSLTTMTNVRTRVTTYRYRVLAPGAEVGFYSTMTGAEALRDTIERATGMEWNEPASGMVWRDRGIVAAGR